MSKRKDVLRMCMAELPEDEGFRHRPYYDTEEVRTIGIGFNIDKRNKTPAHPDLIPFVTGERYFIELDEAKKILGKILDPLYDECASVFRPAGPYKESIWETLSVGQQASILNMYYQLGYKRFTGFVKMIDAINCGNWEDTQNEARDSLWFRQTQDSRTTRVIKGLKP